MYQEVLLWLYEAETDPVIKRKLENLIVQNIKE